jgi:hypothetical protein
LSPFEERDGGTEPVRLRVAAAATVVLLAAAVVDGWAKPRESDSMDPVPKKVATLHAP